MNPPSTQVDAMDNYLSGSIEGLRGSMEAGFDRVERRIDTMVSKDVLTAEVQRLNQRDDHLESKMTSGFSEVKSEMNEGFTAISIRDTERDAAAEKREDARQSKNNRRTTWTISIFAIVWGIVQFFIAPLLGSS